MTAPRIAMPDGKPEINNGHDRTTKNIRVYPGHCERYIAQP